MTLRQRWTALSVPGKFLTVGVALFALVVVAGPTADIVASRTDRTVAYFCASKSHKHQDTVARGDARTFRLTNR